MQDRIIGLEVEYNLAHLSAPGGSPLSAHEASARALEAAWRDLDPGTEMPFWRNGCKLYHDQGHLEWASQECRGPCQALAADKAGERLVAQIAAAAERQLGGKVFVAKNNLDGLGNTFGSHENYSTERRGRLLDEVEQWDYLVRRLIPFLVSRPVVCGSGVWAPGGSPGFHLSQRAAYIDAVVHRSTTSTRAIVNSKDEPHADPSRFRRLHLILGDANIAEIANYLKLATTSLVLEMIEEAFLGEGPEPVDPVAALHAFSADPELRATVPLVGGGRADAIDLQRHYLEAAKLYVAGSGRDDETLRALELWEEVLAKLREDPAQLAGKLDWVTKKVVLASVASQQRWDVLDPRLREQDLEYHGVRRDGNLLSILESSGMLEPMLDESEVASAASDPPPFTRARVRAAAATRGWSVDWAEMHRGTDHLMLDDPLAWCPDEVLDALGLTSTERIAWIATGLAAERPAVRIEALGALRGKGFRGAAVLALDALGDDDPAVRAAAAATLAGCSGRRPRQALDGALADPNFLVRLRAGEALAAGRPDRLPR